MPYATVEKKIAEVSPQYRGELMAFLDYLIFRQKNSVPAKGKTKKASPSSSRRRARQKGLQVHKVAGVTASALRARRKAGGLTGEFYMSPDFDEPLECFKEYM